MYTVMWTDGFERWINRLRDRPTRIRLLRRLEKASRGLLGDIAPVGDGVCEMREFFGPGWRMYFVVSGDRLILMLGGGDKSTQADDIKAARRLAVALREAGKIDEQN